MLWLVSRLVTRGIRIGGQQVFSEKTRSSTPIYIYYFLDTNSLVGSDRDFYKDLSTHSSYSKSKSRPAWGARKNNENRCRGGATRWRFIV